VRSLSWTDGQVTGRSPFDYGANAVTDEHVDDALSPDEEKRLRDHLAGLEEIYVAPIRDRTDRKMPELTLAVVTIDTLAGAHSDSGSLTQKWEQFTRDYLPATPHTHAWYEELRCLLLHNASAGPGLHFTSDPNAPHGSVTAGGGTVVATGQFCDDTVTAYYRFSDDVLSDPTRGRLALQHFDVYPPIRTMPEFYSGVPSVSAAPAPTALPPAARRRKKR
jgi:hypothetical protein